MGVDPCMQAEAAEEAARAEERERELSSARGAAERMETGGDTVSI